MESEIIEQGIENEISRDKTHNPNSTVIELNLNDTQINENKITIPNFEEPILP